MEAKGKCPRVAEKNKVNARLTDDAKDLWELMIARFKTNRLLKGDGLDVTKQSVFNAMVLWLSSRPENEQITIIRSGLKKHQFCSGGESDGTINRGKSKQT